MQPLEGIKILDLSRLAPGPFCSMMLGDLGADVLLVEAPPEGKLAAAIVSRPADAEKYAAYNILSRNKRSIVLNLREAEAREIFYKLAETADVVLEGFRPGVVKRLGVDYDTLSQRNARLVYCSLSGFGQTGPDRTLGGYDFTIQGRAGLMSITGEPEGPPLKVGVAVVDVATALFACNAILAALFARERTGAGQRLDLALFDAQIALLANVGSNFLCSGEVPGRWGNAHASIVPYQTFRAADGYLILAVGNDGQWRRFCAAAGVPTWAEDKRFATNPARVAHRDALVPMLEGLLLKRTAAEWVKLCAGADVPAGPVNTIDRVFSDPQALARGMLTEMPHPTAGTVRMAGTPFHLSETPAAMRLPPPRIGEHTEDILTGLLALHGDEVAALRREGVV